MLRKSIIICLLVGLPQTVEAQALIEGRLGVPSWLVVALFLLLAVVIGSVLSLIFGRRAREKKVSKDLKIFSASLAESKRRLGLIDSHVLDYVNSLPSEVSSEYSSAKLLLDLAERVKIELESLLAVGSYGAVLEAEELLERNLGDFQTGSNSLLGAKIAVPVNCLELERYVDDVFQRVGEEVAKASADAKLQGFKPRKRGQTIEHLFDAGVRYVNRQRRRLKGLGDESTEA